MVPRQAAECARKALLTTDETMRDAYADLARQWPRCSRRPWAIFQRCSICMRRRWADVLRYAIAFALRRARKMRGLNEGLSEDERSAVANHAVSQLKERGDPWGLSEEAKSSQGPTT
jgi:hypothetical protein